VRRSVALVLGIGLLTAACGRSSPGGTLGRLIPLAGIVQVLQDAEWEPVSEAMDVTRGARVRSGPSGGARIELPGKRFLELAANSEIRMATEPELVKGSVLANVGPPLDILVDQVSVTARNAIVRIDKALSVRVAVYQGTALLPESGWGVPLTSFQQVRMVFGAVNSGPQPLIVNPTNAWDLRLLGEAIDVGTSLFRQERGLTSQLQGPGVRDVIIEALSDEFPSTELGSVLAAAAPADVVIAALIASSIDGDPAFNLQQILDLRNAGADWIVIAGRFGVADSVLISITSVVGGILDAMREARREAASARDRTRSVGGGGAAAGIGTSGGGSGSTSSSGGGKSGGGGGPPPPPPPPPPTCTNPVECAVEDVIGDDLPGVG